MRFHLPHKVDGYAHEDEQTCAAEIELHIELLHQEHGHDGNNRDVHAAPKGQAGKHRVDIFPRLVTRTNARNKPTGLFQIFRYILRIKNDGRIEKAEEENKA